MLIFLQIAGGLFLLFLGGESLVRGAVALAKDLGISTFVIGLTVVAYGTSSPEMFISIGSALDGYPDIAFGNVVGSNLSNILCVLGLTSIIYPVAIDKKLGVFDGLFMLGITILLYALCLRGVLDFVSGIVFLTILVSYTFLVFKKAKKQKDTLPEHQTEEIEEQIKVKLNVWQAVLICILGVGFLVAGAEILISGAISLAKIAGLSEAVIGVTLVAFGGSVPELVTSIIAAFHKRSEIVFGNIIGSNLFNILGILGVTSIVSPIEVSQSFIKFDIPFLIVVTIILFAIIYYLPKIYRFLGAGFFASYTAYILYQVL